MGQGASQAQRVTETEQANRRSILRESIRHSSVEEDGLLRGEHSGRRNRPRRRSSSTNRLSQLLRPGPRAGLDESTMPADSSRWSSVQRTASRFRNLMSRSDSTRHTQTDDSRPSLNVLQQRTPYVRAGMNRNGRDDSPPFRLPSIDASSTFDQDLFAPPDEPEPLQRANSSRPPQVAAVAPFNALRQIRGFRHITSSLRWRRSPAPHTRRSGHQDQAVMLSRLLSAAAATTAASLVGDDHQALSQARSLTTNAGMGDLGSGVEDGSFFGFLRALQNGRLASALRQGGDGDSESGSGSREGPLNFLRMFRFGASGDHSPTPLSTGLGDASEPGESTASDDRMVPIIIVGIQSINTNSDSDSGSADRLPPLIDALANFASPLPATALRAYSHDSIDSILRPPQNSTSFRHRRRASIGGFGMGRSRISDRLDDQRDHRSPNRRRERPWSVASSSSNLEPRPPPATPASPSSELSRISSRRSTPSHSRPASFVANSIRDFATDGDSRRNSILRRASGVSPLSSHTEETYSLHSTHSSTNLLSSDEPLRLHSHRRSDTAPNIHYPRFSSGHPRRNGVVEPDNLPSLSRSSTSNATDTPNSNNTTSEGRGNNNDNRSWIIYVLGGSYPETHPILTTPSLLTENPTYEDMMLLSALLGPAKPPVASEEDVQSAGGVYYIELIEPPTVAGAEASENIVAASSSAEDVANTTELIAITTEGDDRVVLEAGQRCLVCLCDFELKDLCRKLVKCNHLFHKECIDQWLTQGRNSCPLCRGQGVDEKENPSTPAPDGSPSRPAELSAS